jgi:hypothetical protein
MGKINTFQAATMQIRRAWRKLCSRLDRASLAVMKTLHIDKQTLVIGSIVLVMLILMLSLRLFSDSPREKTVQVLPKKQKPTLSSIQERLNKQSRLPIRQKKSISKDYSASTGLQMDTEPQRREANKNAATGSVLNPVETQQDRQRRQAREMIAWERRQWEQAARSTGSAFQSGSDSVQSYARKKPSYNTSQSYNTGPSYNTAQSYSNRQPRYRAGQTYGSPQPSYGNYSYSTSDYGKRR